MELGIRSSSWTSRARRGKQEVDATVLKMVWYGPPLEGWERQPCPNLELTSSSFRGDQRWLLRICRWELDPGCMTATSSRSPRGWFEVWH